MSEKKCKILVVDDHEDSGEMLIRFLGIDGYEGQMVQDKAGALRMIKEQTFDVIILDSLLSDGSGIDLCKEIRAFDKITPIIFYSGLASVKDQAEGLAAGAQAYLTKPDGLDKLVYLIKILAPLDCATFQPPPVRDSGTKLKRLSY